MTSQRDEEQVAERARLRIRFPTQGGQAALSGEQKWRRAIELGDLAPDTVVEALRGGEQTSGPASQVPELVPLFVQCGFVLETAAEPEPAPAPPAPEPVAALAAVIAVETPPVKHDSWDEIARAANPGPDPDLPQRLKWVGPEDQRKRALPRDLRRGGSFALAGIALLLLLGGANLLWSLLLLAIALAVWPWPPREAGRIARQAVRERRDLWNSLLKDWHARASRARFDAIIGQLRSAKQGLDTLGQRRTSMLAALDSRDNQLKEHLAAFTIEPGRIPGIGQAQVRTLQRIGYRTAADLSPTLNVIAPLGEQATRTLIGWRAGCAATFVHNPTRSKEPERIRRIDDHLRPERDRLEKPFEGALRRLHETRAEIIAARADLQPKLRAAWFSLCEAKLARRAL